MFCNKCYEAIFSVRLQIKLRICFVIVLTSFSSLKLKGRRNIQCVSVMRQSVIQNKESSKKNIYWFSIFYFMSVSFFTFALFVALEWIGWCGWLLLTSAKMPTKIGKMLPYSYKATSFCIWHPIIFFFNQIIIKHVPVEGECNILLKLYLIII